MLLAEEKKFRRQKNCIFNVLILKDILIISNYIKFEKLSNNENCIKIFLQSQHQSQLISYTILCEGNQHWSNLGTSKG